MQILRQAKEKRPRVTKKEMVSLFYNYFEKGQYQKETVTKLLNLTPDYKECVQTQKEKISKRVHENTESILNDLSPDFPSAEKKKERLEALCPQKREQELRFRAKKEAFDEKTRSNLPLVAVKLYKLFAPVLTLTLTINALSIYLSVTEGLTSSHLLMGQTLTNLICGLTYIGRNFAKKDLSRFTDMIYDGMDKTIKNVKDEMKKDQ